MGAIYVIRHGQASFGVGDYDKLSSTGFEQARVLGESLRARIPSVDAVVCGGMRRHRETAETCLAAMGLPKHYDVDAGWNEFDHEELVEREEPRYANKLTMKLELAATLNPRKAFQQVFERAMARWTGGEHDAEYREPWPQFRTRVDSALQQLVERLGPSKTALVFSSGGPIGTLVADNLGAPDAQVPVLMARIVNASVTKIVYGKRGCHVLSVNEHGHFEGGGGKLITYR